MEFEWDDMKADANLRKHGVSFDEAATVFGDPMALTFADPVHSWVEDRHLTFGLSDAGRYIVVAHTPRRDKERIINARRMTKLERELYEQ